MKIILITSPEEVKLELETIDRLFEEGSDLLHIRKPEWSDEKLLKYVLSLPQSFRNQMAIHGNASIALELKVGGIHQKSNQKPDEIPTSWKGRKSRSTHSIEEIESYQNKYDYYFLSPVFESISKPGYKSSFDADELNNYLTKEREFEIFALGGIDSSHVQQCAEMGFDGVAIMGSIWQKDSLEERLKEFRSIKNGVDQLKQEV